VAALEPLRIANQYGLFAVMTPHRYEIEFQGSNDGTTWTPYVFRYKPQDVNERPRIYAPYQPRFDWNLWFASLTNWQEAPIVPLTEERLLEDDKDVLGLFRGDAFAGRPPKMVRAVLWQYWFSTPEEKRTDGVWWTRELRGTYAPTLERSPDGRFQQVESPTLDGPPSDSP
jgi:lipase maturation factor 1